MKAFNTGKSPIQTQIYNEYTTCIFDRYINKLSTVKNVLPASENNYVAVFLINCKVQSFLYMTIIGNGGSGASSGLAANPKNPNSLFGGAGGGGGGGATQNLKIPLNPNTVYTFYVLLADPGLEGIIEKPKSLNYFEVNGNNGGITTNNNQVYCNLLSPTLFVAANGSPGLAYNSSGRGNGTGVGGMGGSGGIVKVYPYTYPVDYRTGGSGGNGGFGYDLKTNSGREGGTGGDGGDIGTPNPYFSKGKYEAYETPFVGNYGLGISGGGGGGGASNSLYGPGGNSKIGFIGLSGNGGYLREDPPTNPILNTIGQIVRPTTSSIPGGGGGGGSGQTFNIRLNYPGCNGAKGAPGNIIIAIKTNDLQEIPQIYIDNVFSKNNYYNEPNPNILPVVNPNIPPVVNPIPPVVNPIPPLVNPIPPVQTNISKPFVPPLQTKPKEEAVKCIIL